MVRQNLHTNRINCTEPLKYIQIERIPRITFTEACVGGGAALRGELEGLSDVDPQGLEQAGGVVEVAKARPVVFDRLLEGVAARGRRVGRVHVRPARGQLLRTGRRRGRLRLRHAGRRREDDGQRQEQHGYGR